MAPLKHCRGYTGPASGNGKLLWVVVDRRTRPLAVSQPPTGFEASGATLELTLSLGHPAPDREGYERWATMDPSRRSAEP